MPRPDFSKTLREFQARFADEAAGQMSSSLILLVHGEVVDYYCVGNSAAGWRLQSASWLSARELEWARSQGARWWNWGVSPSNLSDQVFQPPAPTFQQIPGIK